MLSSLFRTNSLGEDNDERPLKKDTAQKLLLTNKKIVKMNKV